MAKIKEEELRLNIVVNGDPVRKEMSELMNKNRQLKAANEDLERSQKKLAAAGKEDSNEYKELTRQITANKAAMAGNRDRIDQLTGKLKVNDMTVSELNRRIKDLTYNWKKLDPKSEEWKKCNAELTQTKNRLRELKGSAGETQSVLGKMSSGYSALVGKFMMGYAVIRGFFGLFSGGFKKIKEFEQANVNLSTILGVHVSQMDGLTKSALELGRTTEYTASQVTNLQTELAKLGFGQQQILQMTKPVLQFATVVGAELPEAAALAGATLRAFDKDATETDDVLATMAVATNKSALSFNYLQTSMSIVAPVAKTFGFDVKDTTALLGTLANSGFDASSAATATRNILLNLADANGKLAKELGKPVRSLPDLIDGLKKLDAKGVNLAKTLELTDKRSVAAFNTFLRGADNMAELRNSLQDVDGELKRISEERMNSVEGSIKLMNSAWEGFMLTFYESRGKIKTVLDWIVAAINGINDLMLGEEGIRRREQEKIQTSIIETTTKRFKMQFDTASGATIDEKIEATTAAVKEKLQKYMDEIWGGLADKELIDKAISQGLEQAAKLVRETEDKRASDAERARKEQQQAAAAAAYKALDEKELAERIALKQKYLNGEIATEQEYNDRLLQLNIDALKKRLKSGELKGKERLTMEEQLTTLLLQQKKEEQKRLDEIEDARIKAIVDATERENAEYARRKQKAQGNTQLLEQLEAQHTRNLAKIQLDKINTAIANDEAAYKRSRQNLKNQQASELLAFTGSAEAKKNLRKRHNEELLNLEAQYAKKMAERLQELLDNGNFEGMSLDNAILSDEEKNKLQQKLLEVKEMLVSIGVEVENIHSDELKGVNGTTDLLGFSLEDWATLFTNLENGKIGVKEIAMALSAMASVYATYDKFATASENRQLQHFKKANDQKKKELQRRLDKGIISQEQYNTKVEQLDESYEAKQEELQLKQARRQKSLSIIEAIINTAVGAAAALKLGPIIGPILAAMVSAMGAAQVALIAAQPIAGAEEGGFPVERMQDGKRFNAQLDPDARGYVKRPTVLVGENGMEYVIPNEAMQNPTARPIIDTIEAVRRKGRLRDFDFSQILPTFYTMPGRVAGGQFTSTTTLGDGTAPNASMMGNYDPALLRSVHDVVEKLSAKLDEPIYAYVTLLGRNGLIEQMKKYERNKNLGKLG